MNFILSFISTIILILFGSTFGFTKTNSKFQNGIASDTTFIYMKVFGVANTGRNDVVNLTNNALKELKGDQPKVVIFEPGTYHFYPENCQRRNYFESNTTDENPRVCALLFEGIKNLTIRGKGSQFIFHEQMQPFTFDNCENVVLKDVTIDWEKPMTAQAEVVNITDDYLDLKIDQKEFPYKLIDGKLVFVGHNWQENWKSTMEFDRTGHFVVSQTGDRGCLGNNWQDYIAENIIPGLVRLYHHFERKPAKGNFLVMRHSERIHAGIFIQDSKNIEIKNVTLYHATGLGILAQFSKNLTFDGYRAIPNPEKKRYFGGGDDGLQVSNCKGNVIVRNCEFAGLMDDPINVHGTSVQVTEIISEHQLKCKFMHHQSEGLNWGHSRDQIGFIENSLMKTIAVGELESFEPINKETFVLTFKNPILNDLEVKDALENLTWTPDLLFEHSHFKSCRARGLLVSTPGKVIIRDNIFESSGSAILIAGDANNWFESGAVTDVRIQNNVFTELCNTSSYQFCEGIISIYPEIPKLNEKTPCFHKNITITDNEFHPFDYPVLFARSVNGITFTNNTLTRSKQFEPYHSRKYTYSFEACKNINLSGNIYNGDILGKNILLRWTDKKELHVAPTENLATVEM